MKRNDEADNVPLAQVVSSSKPLGPAPGELVKQKHGGSLRHGSASGNPGNKGAPPSLIVEAARLSFAQRIPALCAIVDDESNTPQARVGALRLLADTGQIGAIVVSSEESDDAKEYSRKDVEKMWRQMEQMKTIKQLERALADHAKKGERDE